MKRSALFLTVLLLAGLPARAQLCGPTVKHSTAKVEGKSSLETDPPAGKALLYVLAPTYEAGYLQLKVSADRSWIGVNQYRSYFVAALEPGTHDFCSKMGRDVVHLKLSLEAGKSYFLEQDADAKSLLELSAEDAAVLLRKCKRTIFWVKGMPKPAELAVSERGGGRG